jgi:hypothetical protein
MKYLQTFSLFESRTPGTLTKRQETFLNQYTRGTWSVNPATGLVDVQGWFDCSSRGLKFLSGIKFGAVRGSFYCAGNKLTTLEGAPQTVEKNFNCRTNQLTTLVGAPQTVKGDFWCDKNQLTTLEGGPLKVGRGFYCYNNQITSLEGAPRTVGGIFYCDTFTLGSGEWNPTGWLEVLRTGSLNAQKLILTLPYLQPDWWNSELSKNPARTIQKLAPWWSQMSDELKRGIRIPPGYEDRFGMRSEFSELGLF